MGKGGSVSDSEGNAMSEDVLVNTSTVQWPDPESARCAVGSDVQQVAVGDRVAVDPSRAPLMSQRAGLITTARLG